MKVRDVVIAVVVLALLIAGALYYKKARVAVAPSPLPEPTVNFQTIESKFPGLTVPANADRINLNGVGGMSGLGEAWRAYDNGKYSLTVMADLPAPKSGFFYQGWLGKDGNYLSLGQLQSSKGGYLVEFSSSKDYSDYKDVLVTQEKYFNSTPETHLLEGSFK